MTETTKTEKTETKTEAQVRPLENVAVTPETVEKTETTETKKDDQ